MLESTPVHSSFTGSVTVALPGLRRQLLHLSSVNV